MVFVSSLVPHGKPQAEVSDKLKRRFESYAEGEGDKARLKRENLRSVLESWLSSKIKHYTCHYLIILIYYDLLACFFLQPPTNRSNPSTGKDNILIPVDGFDIMFGFRLETTN